VTARVSLVMCVFNGLELTRACLDSLRHASEPFALVVADNGSSDGTAQFFRDFAYPFPLTYVRNEQNAGVIASLNRAWRLARTEYLCLLHNDTQFPEPCWLGRVLAALSVPGVGLAGLYGAKRIRRDGRFAGRTVVHSLAEQPTVRPPWEEVAVVDGVCMALRRDLMESIGGFDERYGFFHGYDRDLSFAVRERGLRAVVVHAPFVHEGGGTRTRRFGVDTGRERADLAQRRDALTRFVRKYRDRLPCDVRPVAARTLDFVRHQLARGGLG
jgi:GT2 family glycosyltransferase